MSIHIGKLAAGLVLLGLTLGGAAAAEARDERTYDVVVYGGTSAGVIAAVQAQRMGRTTVLVSPDRHLGGMTSNGLGWTDSGNTEVIGGLSREFYHRVYLEYQREDAWRWESREDYGNVGQGTPAIDGDERTMWTFEPHIAERVFEALIDEHEVPVHRDEWLDRENGVEMDGDRIVSITTLSGRTYRGRMFIDATYEGDLMAAAGVSYTVGRESNATYGETLNGVQKARTIHHQFDHFVDPYVEPGDPSSGLLPRIHGDDPGEDGEGDHRVQAYNFRLCLTRVPENRVPFPKPDNYDPQPYELLGRYIDAGWRGMFHKFDPIPNLKTDTNNHGAFSTDNIGMNYDYPEASYERRREIVREHEAYQKGYFWFLANDPRVPAEVRDRMSEWGLAKDEFEENDHWPRQLYVREARRMVSDFVVAEPHLRRIEPTPRPVGMGSYNMDSHNTQRYVAYDEEGRAHARNEGDIQINPGAPYPIDYGALVPRRGECENLLVPVCASTSHIAFGSIRMEPVFMILAQSAVTAAVQAIEGDIAVQDVDYAALRERLLEDGQVLEWDGPTPSDRSVRRDDLDGVVVTDAEAAFEGDWPPSTAVGRFVGLSYRHDDDAGKGSKTARFEADLPESGEYEVRLAYSPHENRASNVPVTIDHGDGEDTVTIDQRGAPEIDGLFVSLGTFRFSADEPTVVTISNEGTDGYVIADAVQFLPVD